jgi:hypothetical protein
VNIEHKMCHLNLMTISVEINYTFYLQCGLKKFLVQIKDRNNALQRQLNFKASKKIDFDLFKQIVCHMREERINITQSKNSPRQN